MVTAADAVDCDCSFGKTVDGGSCRCCCCCWSLQRAHQPMLRQKCPASWASRPVAAAAEFPVWKQSCCRTVGGQGAIRQVMINTKKEIKGESVSSVKQNIVNTSVDTRTHRWLFKWKRDDAENNW